MKWLRIVLLLASFAGCIFALGVTKQEVARTYDPTGAIIIGLGIAALFALNFLYLLSSQPIGGNYEPGRFRRMFSLWMTAKERDLERRAKPD